MKSKIKKFEDACKALKIDPKKLPDLSALPEKHQKALLAHYKLVIIAEALNEGWQPDWSNYNEYKYYPWFEIDASKDNPAGSGFSGSNYDCWDTNSYVGSRLCFKSRELALYAGKQFEDLYIEYFLIK